MLLLIKQGLKSVYEEDIKVLKRKIHLREVAITELKRKLELAQKQNDEIQLIVENFENSSKNLSKLIDYEIVDKCKTGLWYNVVSPPYTGNFVPPKLELSGLEEFVNESIVSEPTVKKPIVETSEAKANADKPKAVRKNFGPPLIEDWISDSEDEAESESKIKKKTVNPSFAKIEFVKSKEQVKYPRKTTVKQDEAVNEEMDDSLERATTTATSLNAEQVRGNIFKTQSKATPNEPGSQGTSLGGNPRFQETMGDNVACRKTKKITQALEIGSLKRRVKKLERRKRSRTRGLKRLYTIRLSGRVKFSEDEGLVTTAATTLTISIDEVTLAQALVELKHINPKAKAKGIVFHEPEQSTTTTTAAGIPKSKSHDKSKAKMIKEPEQRLANKKAQQEEEANISLIGSWDDVQKINDDKDTAELKQLVKLIPDEEGVAIDAIPLVVKPPSIVDWKIQKEGKKSYYKIIEADRSSNVYLIFSHMLKYFDREDVEIGKS
nr:hypothetical protein [Tanacetum cinerariifolium]